MLIPWPFPICKWKLGDCWGCKYHYSTKNSDRPSRVSEQRIAEWESRSRSVRAAQSRILPLLLVRKYIPECLHVFLPQSGSPQPAPTPNPCPCPRVWSLRVEFFEQSLLLDRCYSQNFTFSKPTGARPHRTSYHPYHLSISLPELLSQGTWLRHVARLATPRCANGTQETSPSRRGTPAVLSGHGIHNIAG